MTALRVFAFCLALLVANVAYADGSTLFPLVHIKDGQPEQIGLATQIDDSGLFYTARHLLPDAQIGPYTGDRKLAISSSLTLQATIATIFAIGSYSSTTGQLADDWVLFQIARGTDDDDLKLEATSSTSFARLTPALLDTAAWNRLEAGAGMRINSNNSNWSQQSQQASTRYDFRRRPLVSQGCVTSDPLLLELGLAYAAGQSGMPFVQRGDNIDRVVGVSSRWAVPQEIFAALDELKRNPQNVGVRKYLNDLLLNLKTRASWEAVGESLSITLDEFFDAVSIVLSKVSDAQYQDALHRLEAATKDLDRASRLVSIAPAACILNFFVENGDQFDAEAYISVRSSLARYKHGMEFICNLAQAPGESDMDFVDRAEKDFRGTVGEVLATNLTNRKVEFHIIDLLALRAWATNKCAKGGKQFLSYWFDQAILAAINGDPVSDPGSRTKLAMDFTRALSEETDTQTASKQPVPLDFTYNLAIPGGVSGYQFEIKTNFPSLGGSFPSLTSSENTPAYLEVNSDLPYDYLYSAVKNDHEAALIMSALAQGIRETKGDNQISEKLEADAAWLAGNAIRINSERFAGKALPADAQNSANQVVNVWLSKQPATVLTSMPNSNRYVLPSGATVGEYLQYLKSYNALLLGPMPNVETFEGKQHLWQWNSSPNIDTWTYDSPKKSDWLGIPEGDRVQGSVRLPDWLQAPDMPPEPYLFQAPRSHQQSDWLQAPGSHESLTGPKLVP